MKLCLLLLLSTLLLLLVRPASAQDGTGSAASTQAALPAQVALQIDPMERQFFALGMTVSRGAFAYAELAKQASAVAKTRSKIAQVRQLGRLDPVAGRNRAEAKSQLAQAAALMRRLHAPDFALAPVIAAEARLAGPLPMTSDAQTLTLFSRAAARTLSSLSEFEILSSLPEDAAIRRWLHTPELAHSAQVWYGEGEIAGLSEIAATHQMPDLLPPTEQIATDLRGLRDWLALRLPDSPTSAQAGLKNDLDLFLAETSQLGHPGAKSRKLLTAAQLQSLGSISRRLQTEVLGVPTAETAQRL